MCLIEEEEEEMKEIRRLKRREMVRGTHISAIVVSVVDVAAGSHIFQFFRFLSL